MRLRFTFFAKLLPTDSDAAQIIHSIKKEEGVLLTRNKTIEALVSPPFMNSTNKGSFYGRFSFFNVLRHSPFDQGHIFSTKTPR